MSILRITKKPLYYATIYITPLSEQSDFEFKKTSSMLVTMAGTELGYNGFEIEHAADNRIVCVCYWDSFGSLSRWTDKAEKLLKSNNFALNSLLCSTGCLWPWLIEKRKNQTAHVEHRAA